MFVEEIYNIGPFLHILTVFFAYLFGLLPSKGG